MDTNIDNELISVVMSVYNGADYVADAIKSILNQSYGNWIYYY